MNNKKYNNAFTLIELLVVIAIIMILIIGLLGIDFKGQENRENLNIKVNEIISFIETVSFNDLLGKGIKGGLPPEKRQIKIWKTTNDKIILEKYFLSGTTWQLEKTKKIFKKGMKLKDFYFSNFDGTNTGAITSTGIIIFEGGNLSFSGTEAKLEYQNLKMKLKLKNFEEEISINAISGIIEKK